MNAHLIPATIDGILDEQYRRHQERINRATDKEIAQARNAVERIAERPAKESRFKGRAG